MSSGALAQQDDSSQLVLAPSGAHPAEHFSGDSGATVWWHLAGKPRVAAGHLLLKVKEAASALHFLIRVAFYARNLQHLFFFQILAPTSGQSLPETP